MSSLGIYLYDLDDAAQREVLDFYGLEKDTDGNLDVIPLFVLENDDE